MGNNTETFSEGYNIFTEPIRLTNPATITGFNYAPISDKAYEIGLKVHEGGFLSHRTYTLYKPTSWKHRRFWERRIPIVSVEVNVPNSGFIEELVIDSKALEKLMRGGHQELITLGKRYLDGLRDVYSNGQQLTQ